MDPEDEQRKRLLIYFKDFDCVEYKFLQSFFGDINVDEDHEDENRAKDELNVEKIHNEKMIFALWLWVTLCSVMDTTTTFNNTGRRVAAIIPHYKHH